ncbi:MAG: DUF4856 domain-containing protein [Myxococcota bacterium]
MRRPSPHLLPAVVLLLAGLAGCPTVDTDDDTDTETTDTDADTDTDTDGDADIVPSADHYRFPSRGDASVDSVSYDGQVFRNLLIEDMKIHIGGLTSRLDGGFFPAAGDVRGELEFYFEFDSATSGTLPIGFDPGTAVQATYDDVSTEKDLVGKIAGNDAVGQHVDWSTGFVGWADPAVTTPESLVRHWFDTLDAQAVDWSIGTYPLDPSGAPVPAVYLTSDGRDLQQLLQKFLGGAVSFSQGADDYLDDDEPGKGLLSDHSVLEAGEPYTALEHAWDEGFGYFGAARAYPSFTDAVIASPGYADVDGDAVIDLHSEVCWGHSTNSAKRDLGASPSAPTDLTADAWAGFWEGRALLASTSGALTPAELDTLRQHRNTALDAWEKAIGATIVHYVNDVLKDMGRFDTPDYVFADHAKHWSELKGFALALQFNPHSPVSDGDFATLHGLIGQAPVLPSADAPTRAAYAEDLRAARVLLGTAYGFDPANLGDADGQNGW